MQLKKSDTRRYVSLFIFTLLFIFFATSQLTLANNAFENPLKFDSLQDLLEAVITTVIYFMTPIITLMVIYTGFLFIRAQGNPAKLTEARTALMWCLIGAVIVLGALGISAAIKATVDDVVSTGN